MYNPSLYKVYAHKSYRLHMADTAFRTRDQLLVSGVLDGDTTHVIVAHWPSRRGGEKRSEPNRKAAAELGRHIIDSLASLKAKTLGRLFNPMYEPYQKGIGTLAWRDSWNLFDQIAITPALVSGAGGQYHYYGVRIFNEPYLRQEEGNFAGYPSRTFVGDIYQDGYSDHFPVFLILVKEVNK
jgi:hypothetical protein